MPDDDPIDAIEERLSQIEQLLTTQQAQVVPVGAIIPWWGDRNLLPVNFQLCDGGVIDDPDSPLKGKRRPDLTNRFLKGAGDEDGSPADVIEAFRTGGRNKDARSATEETPLSPDQMPRHGHGTTEQPHGHPWAGDAIWKGPQGVGGGGRRLRFPGMNVIVEPVGRSQDRVELESANSPVAGSTTGLTVNEAGWGKGHAHDIPEHDNQPSYLVVLYVIRIK